MKEQHQQGASKTFTACKKYDDQAAATAAYHRAARRVLNPAAWHDLHALGTIGNFVVCDASGKPTDGPPHVGNYLRIDSKAPDNRQSESGADWVRVEEIGKDYKAENGFLTTSMKVRTSPDPTSNDEDTAHFFADTATSTFKVQLQDREVVAAIAGEGEQPNTDVPGFLSKLRNLFVALTALGGGSGIIWKPLAEGFLREE